LIYFVSYLKAKVKQIVFKINKKYAFFIFFLKNGSVVDVMLPKNVKINSKGRKEKIGGNDRLFIKN